MDRTLFAPPTIGSVELCQLTGASYRQIDYWCRSGYIDCEPGRGSGTQRSFRPAEVVQALVLSRVANLVPSLLVASRVARIARDRFESHDVMGRSIVIYGDGDMIVVGHSEVHSALEVEPIALVVHLAALLGPALQVFSPTVAA